MPDRAEDLGPRSVDGTDWVSQRIRRHSDAFRVPVQPGPVVAGLAESTSCVEKLTHAHRNVSGELVRCAGVAGSGHIVDAAAAERPDSMLADRPPTSSSLDETIWRAACKPAAQPISVESRTGASISRGSRAHAPGAQLVSASVAPLAWLQARRRDLSTIGPNGVHRRCSTAGRWTLNGRFGDEYGSSPLYGSVTGTHTPRAVSLGSLRGLSRSSWPATCYLAPAAVGTSPTGLSGTAASRGVRARRRAVGPTR